MSTGAAGHGARSTVRPNGETGRPGPVRTFLRTVDGVTIDAAYDPGCLVYGHDHDHHTHDDGHGHGHHTHDDGHGHGHHTHDDGHGHGHGAYGADDTGRPPPGHLADLAIVVAHGFTGHLERSHVRRVAGVLARYGAVVTFSFRGHGASGGLSTVGDREVDDLAVAVEWARELGHSRVATVGFSMGGSVVLRHAAQHREGSHTDAVVAVSSPARWFYRGTAPMRRLHWLVTRPEGRLVGRYGLRTRIHHRDWDPVPASPVESVPLIAPTPLLVVHGDQDGYFPVDHARMLAEAARGHAELWLEPGMGHAEHASDDGLLARIGAWAASRAG